MLAADFGTGEVLWSFLWFFIFIIWIYLLIFIFSDIFRSDDLSGWGKALWTILIIFLPYIGIFAYLIARGGKMAERQAKQMQTQQAAMDSYIRDDRHRRVRRRTVGQAGRTAHVGQARRCGVRHGQGQGAPGLNP